jgi:hypothetical protein
MKYVFSLIIALFFSLGVNIPIAQAEEEETR